MMEGQSVARKQVRFASEQNDIYSRIVEAMKLEKLSQGVSTSICFLTPFAGAALGLSAGLFLSWAAIRSFERLGVPMSQTARVGILASFSISGIYFCGIKGMRLGLRIWEKIETLNPPPKKRQRVRFDRA